MDRTGVVVAVWTVGHSTRSIDELAALLIDHGIERLVDVRTIPRSRHNPQFNREALEAAGLPFAYRHAPELGGLRRPHADSLNLAWRHPGFRGFADYMETPDFAMALDQLIGEARAAPTAIMCAEAVPWRCHRSLIADALAARGLEVRHVTGPGEPRIHTLTPFARLVGDCVTYHGLV